MFEIPCIDVDQKFTLHFIVYCKQGEGFRVLTSMSDLSSRTKFFIVSSKSSISMILSASLRNGEY